MHAYEQTDEGVFPRHLVPMSSRPDELRPTRITDLRKWWRAGRKVYPSVTEVGNVLAKHALVNWRIERHLEQAWKFLPNISNGEYWPLENYIPEIKCLTEIELDRAPKAGTDIHKALEAYFSEEMDQDDPNFPLCNAAYTEIVNQTSHLSWITEHNFISNLGYGGQVDLHNEEWVIDFKSKQTADKFKPGKMVYPEHSQQLAAYREGLGLSNARCANVFISLEDGQVDFHEHTPEQLETGWQLFYHALRIWQIQHGAPQ